MKKTVIITGAMLVAAVYLNGCKDESKSNNEQVCQVGTLDCECVANSCNAGLTCEDNVCVALSTDSEPDTGSDTTPNIQDTGVDTNPTTSSITLTNDAGRICVEGVVVGPESNDDWEDHWGAGVGVNLCQPDPDAANTKVALEDCPTDLSSLTGVNITFSGTLPTALWVNFEDDITADANSYHIVDTIDASNYLFSEAQVWYQSEAERPTIQTGRILSVQFQVAAQLASTEEFAFCIENVSLITGDASSDTDTNTDTGTDTIADTDTAAADTDTACNSDSMVLTADEYNWVDGCTNALGVQGFWYSYSD